MKIIASTLVATLAYIGSTISAIWAIVEFILYLAKDHQFNWWSVWTCIGFFVIGTVSVFISTAYAIKDFENKRTERKTSSFQSKLEQMKKDRL